MIARALVAILLMMNLCVAVWWASGGAPARARAVPALAADRNGLTLLAEAPGLVAPAQTSVAEQKGAIAGDDTNPPPIAAAPPVAESTLGTDQPAPVDVDLGGVAGSGEERCFSLGPFTTHDELARVSMALTANLRRQQVRETEVSEADGYQVLLPALPDRSAALAAAKALQTAGVRDYYVITSGEQRNAISLGLFRDLGNAERRRDALRALGFDARLLPRQRQRSQWWLDIAVDESDDWRALIGEPVGWRIETFDCR